MNQEQINHEINLINNIITRNSPNDFIQIMSNLTVSGNANFNMDINAIAKSKNIDPKKNEFYYCIFRRNK